MDSEASNAARVLCTCKDRRECAIGEDEWAKIRRTLNDEPAGTIRVRRHFNVPAEFARPRSSGGLPGLLCLLLFLLGHQLLEGRNST